ncbi:FKBP-type peptidyl-prolyl cis-trans isomerase [Dinghuibacter silviterrae]|uniref:Peptidyl-prolyl cis-trans isomerase n=1 Tax=Dinghuibacter silviterrae TaxID=1539049 RepID=A0A4V6Q9U6_9BACT|nr:peptidylprolyl isomerase [Dinghuibacter silviterrae]TDW95752.1 peptidylprolyl isomerase [Dinghuibacter silviterrae]
MQQVKKGDKVRVHYHGKLTNGETFDSSEGRAPLEFIVGAGMMIKGFDAAVVGMTLGEKKTVNIPAAEAYGEYEADLLMEFPRDQFPKGLTPEVGMQLTMTNGAGQQIPVTIAAVKEDVVVLDRNHFLAGKELVFDITLAEIV